MDARLRVLYLLTVAVGVFFLPSAGWVAAVLALQVILWLVVGLPPRRLLRQVGKLWLFSLVILLSYAFTAQDPATDRWVPVDLLGWTLRVNVPGAWAGLAMVLRLLTVVLASQVARAGDPRAVAQGLRGLGVPRMVSASIDTVLALFGETGRRPGGGGGHGGGGGGGGGGGRGGEPEAPEGFGASLRRLLRGDVSSLLRRVHQQIDKAEAHAREALGEAAGARARDVGVIAGVSLTMLGIKMLKLLPSIPFAPGHKGVLLLPLYVAAARLTGTRLGGTLTGLTMGTVAFLMGDGRYGILEIVKHVAPGVLCDLGLPLLLAGGRRPGAFAWSVFGLLLALARFGTIFTITLLVQAPAVAYAFLVPGLVIHGTFGFLSGYVSYHLLRGLDRAAQPSTDPRETS